MKNEIVKQPTEVVKKKRTRVGAGNFKMAKLSEAKQELITMTTPPEFIKERPGNKGRTFSYVSIGYVTAKLNQVFSTLNWEFSITKYEILTEEVIVQGKLTIKELKTGYTVSKEQFGVHKIGKGQGMTIGDSLKSAGSDCLKKCASMLGIGLDVYWDEVEAIKKNEVKREKKGNGGYYKQAIAWVERQTDKQILASLQGKIIESDLYTKEEKRKLVDAISKKLKPAVCQTKL